MTSTLEFYYLITAAICKSVQDITTVSILRLARYMWQTGSINERFLLPRQFIVIWLLILLKGHQPLNYYCNVTYHSRIDLSLQNDIWTSSGQSSGSSDVGSHCNTESKTDTQVLETLVFSRVATLSSERPLVERQLSGAEIEIIKLNIYNQRPIL